MLRLTSPRLPVFIPAPGGEGVAGAGVENRGVWVGASGERNP
jgi:hypothetical protein